MNRYVQSDRLGRSRSSPNATPEDTRDICTRDVQLIEQEKIPDKTNHFERLGVTASRVSLKGCRDVQIASHKGEL